MLCLFHTIVTHYSTYYEGKLIFLVFIADKLIDIYINIQGYCCEAKLILKYVVKRLIHTFP